MTDPVTAVLGGIVIAVVSVGIGKYCGSNHKVDEHSCVERREAINSHMCAELKHIRDDQGEIKKDVKTLLKQIKIEDC